MTVELEVELVLDAHAQVGEGPVWDDRTSTLVWVDIMGQTVHVYDPATGEDKTMDVGQPVGAAALRDQGGLVLALRDGFAIIDQVPGDLRWVAKVEEEVPTNRMNDGKCDPAGRFWAGTMSFSGNVPHAGALYRLDPDYRVTRVVPDITLSNGLDWSLDNKRMYYIDSMTQHIDTFDFDLHSGNLTNRQTVLDIPKSEGLPDGMTLDAEGGLWLAQHGSGTVRRYLASGEIDNVVRLPVKMVTCPAFGGPDYGDLYITTMHFGMSPEALREQPQAGALFRCRPGVRGRPAFRFAG
jgi:sugar lactone lactonase YvrE